MRPSPLLCQVEPVRDDVLRSFCLHSELTALNAALSRHHQDAVHHPLLRVEEVVFVPCKDPDTPDSNPEN